MTEYAGKFTVGDGVPAWVVPVTYQNGYMVVDNSEGDDRGLDWAYAALAASGEPVAPATGLRQLLNMLPAASDNGRELIHVQLFGDACIIFCSRQRMELMSVEDWRKMKIFDGVHKLNRPPAIEAERKAARAKVLADDKRCHQEKMAGLELAHLMKSRKGMETWSAWDVQMVASAYGKMDLYSLLYSEPWVLPALFERACIHRMKMAEMKALAKEKGVTVGKLDRFYLGIKLADTVPLPARGGP